jgi:hypothetical protein
MFSFTCGVNGIDYTTLPASVEISENQWFNGVLFFRIDISNLIPTDDSFGRSPASGVFISEMSGDSIGDLRSPGKT